MAVVSDKDGDANPGRSAGARAIEARAAIATAQLRSTVTSISASAGCTSAHGERIVATIEDLVDDVLPELEAAEALTVGAPGNRAGGVSASRGSVWVDNGSTSGTAS